jgi:hypothetical protein
VTSAAHADLRRTVGLVVGLRSVAAVIVIGLVTCPLIVLPSPYLAWLAVPALVLGVAGLIVLSVPLVTASASLALVEYALALVIRGAPVDVISAAAVGTALVLLLEAVHLASRIDGAVIGRAVVWTHVRSWLAIVALGVASSAMLAFGGTSLRLALTGTSLPLVVVASAAGALLAVGGVLWLVTRPPA